MAEAKEEGPGPRARVSGGRGGGQRGGVRGRGQAGRGPRPGRLRGCSVRGAAAPAAVQGPDERPRRAGGPAASPGCPAEPACRSPPSARQAAPGRRVAAARSLQAGEQCCPRWPPSHAASQGFSSFPVVLKESVQASFSWHHLHKLIAH